MRGFSQVSEFLYGVCIRLIVTVAFCVALTNEGGGRGSRGTGRVWSSSGGDKAATGRHQQHSRTSLIITYHYHYHYHCTAVANACDISL